MPAPSQPEGVRDWSNAVVTRERVGEESGEVGYAVAAKSPDSQSRSACMHGSIFTYMYFCIYITYIYIYIYNIYINIYIYIYIYVYVYIKYIYIYMYIYIDR